MMKLFLLLLGLVVVSAQNCCPHVGALCETTAMAGLTLPQGFCLSQFVSTSSPRTLDIHHEPDLGAVVFVGSRDGNTMHVFIDEDIDGRSDREITFATGQNRAHTASMRDNKLYLGQGTRLVRFDNIMDHIRAGTNPSPTVMYSGWGTAASGNHGDRMLTWANNNTDLYISIGSPCNTCRPEQSNCPVGTGNCFFGQILRVPDVHARNTLQLADFQSVATGVRNSVGLTTNPNDNQIWFTDNGRDNWGDNRPMDELNFFDVNAFGQDFGFPNCYGYGDADTTYNPSGSCAAYTPAAVELGPHVAGLGLAFYTGNMFPPPYNSGIFVAEHGSWNRRPFIGFRVTHVPLLKNGEPDQKRYETFLDGFLTNPTFGTRFGRPSDVAVHPDGSLLITDDQANVIWRIHYQP